jgi:hypothetical protein
MERLRSKDETLFCFDDTIYSDTLIRHIRSIFEKLPVSEEDTSFEEAPESELHRDTCYGRGFLFLMTSLLGGKTRDYQNCCSDCTIELVEEIEANHFFQFTRKDLLNKASQLNR